MTTIDTKTKGSAMFRNPEGPRLWHPECSEGATTLGAWGFLNTVGQVEVSILDSSTVPHYTHLLKHIYGHQQPDYAHLATGPMDNRIYDIWCLIQQSAGVFWHSWTLSIEFYLITNNLQDLQVIKFVANFFQAAEFALTKVSHSGDEPRKRNISLTELSQCEGYRQYSATIAIEM